MKSTALLSHSDPSQATTAAVCEPPRETINQTIGIAAADPTAPASFSSPSRPFATRGSSNWPDNIVEQAMAVVTAIKLS